MKSWTVYEHWSPSGKVYVGITSNVKNRWCGNGYYYHLSDTAFSRALNKYGWDNFTHKIILEGRPKSEALYAEKYLIRWYKIHNISYNMSDGGEGYWGKHTEEHNRHKVESRIANSKVDYLVIDQDFNYIICNTEREAAEFLDGVQSNVNHILRQPIGYTFRKHYLWKHEKGTPVDIEDIKCQIQKALQLRHQKCSEQAKARSKELVAASQKVMAKIPKEEWYRTHKNFTMKGRHLSEETKKKMSMVARGRDMSKAIMASTKARSKPVVQMLNGLIINTFNSAKEASDITGINMSGICQCANGVRKSAGGFTWVYKKEKEVCYDE